MISQYEKSRSENFMNALNSLLDIIEKVLPYINEQEYLTACNDLKTLHDGCNIYTPEEHSFEPTNPISTPEEHSFEPTNPEPPTIRSLATSLQSLVQNLRIDDVVRQHERRARMKVNDKDTNIQLSDAFKLKNGWVCCRKCDRIVKDVLDHQSTDVCKRTYRTKKLSQDAKVVETSDMATLIHHIRAWAIKWNRPKFYA
jgi:hypothetical protein